MRPFVKMDFVLDRNFLRENCMDDESLARGENVLTPETVVARLDKVPTAPAFDDLVIVNPEDDGCYGLNSVGRRIWELLENPMKVEDLCRCLTAEFDVEAELCRREVLAFLSEMERYGMVRCR